MCLVSVELVVVLCCVCFVNIYCVIYKRVVWLASLRVPVGECELV